MYQMLFGEYPFAHDDSNQMIDKLSIIRGDYGFPINSVISDDAMDLIEAILQFDPHKRPSAADIINSNWFADVRHAVAEPEEDTSSSMCIR